VRLRLALAGIAAGTTLLAGCTGDDASADPSPDETSSSSEPTEETTEPDLEAPELPEAATEQSEAGAEAFVRYFVDVINHAQATGDAEAIAQVSEPDCGACTGFIDATNSAYESGGRIEGGTFTLTDVAPLPVDYGADAGFYLTIQIDEQTIFGADGPVQRAEPLEYRIGAYPGWTEDRWSMVWIATPEPA